MNADFIRQLYQAHQEAAACPAPHLVTQFFERLMGVLFPEFSNQEFGQLSSFEQRIDELRSALYHLLKRNNSPENANFEQLTTAFFEALPEIRGLLQKDIQAMYDGDPAAKSLSEVVRTYPGFLAIAAHRMAHWFEQRQVHIFPRIISEYAHSRTGIDIHPGAQIGAYFCIDHGTGIVIGETTIIGDHVKIYQGVTLGGLSVHKNDASTKRHPTLENHVVIYAGATILGGTTTVGAHSVIGGNVWLTQSVPPHSKVYYKASMSHNIGPTDTITFKP